MSRSDNPENRQFEIPVEGADPITKGPFTVEWAVIGYEYGDDDEEKIFFAGQVTIQGKDNPFYKTLIETPLLAQDHPLMVKFADSSRFIKIIMITDWEHDADDIVGYKITMNVRFQFLDNLGYFEEITTFKDNNLL